MCPDGCLPGDAKANEACSPAPRRSQAGGKAHPCSTLARDQRSPTPRRKAWTPTSVYRSCDGDGLAGF